MLGAFANWGLSFFYENKTVKCFLLPQMFYSLLGNLACLMAWMFLVEGLDKTCTRYKMEISAEKTKLMTNSDNGIQREIKVKGQKLGTVTSSKYLGAVVSDDGSKPEVLSRIAQTTAAFTKLNPILRDNNISLGSKVKLMRSLVISIFLYACES